MVLSGVGSEKKRSKNVPPGQGPVAEVQPSIVTGHASDDDSAATAGAGMNVTVAASMVSLDGHFER
jgi:hypothetical protein